MVNYICPIFRFATQTFNGGYKRKMNTDKPYHPGSDSHGQLFYPAYRILKEKIRK